MTLTLENIGKVRKADMLLDGITVIVGDNNMGKTTAGRALYAFFNSLYRIDNEVSHQRRFQIKRLIQGFFEKFRRPIGYSASLNELVKRYLEQEDNIGTEIVAFLQDRLLPRVISQVEIDRLVTQIDEIKHWSNRAVRGQIISQYFESVFSGQCISLSKQADGGRIRGDIDGHSVEIEFKGGGLTYNSDINIQHQAYFVDSPDVLNYWSSLRFSNLGLGYSALSYSFRKAIESAIAHEGAPTERVFDNLLFADRYEKFAHEISAVMGGRFVFDKNNVLRFQELGSSEKGEDLVSFELNNVSEGLKSFGVIELMLRYKILRDGDVLVLDEPEIHLHPEWQLKYAEILVKLQKEFQLTVLVTTHSSTFMLALQMCSQIAGRKNVVNTYRISSHPVDRRYSELISDNPFDWDNSYMTFISAAQKLNALHAKAFSSGVEHDDE